MFNIQKPILQKREVSIPSSWLERNYGEVHRIPHQLPDSSGREVDLPHNLKEIWLNKNGTSPVYHICGELSSLFTIMQTLDRKRKINLLISNELIKSETRDTLAELLEKNKDLLTVYSADKRPDMHGTMIDNNMFIEDWHDFGRDYLFGTVIENAKRDKREEFMKYFKDKIKGPLPLNPAQIRSIPIKSVTA